MIFSVQKLDLLVDLFRDLAKGLLLGAIAVPAIASKATAINSIKLGVLGLVFTYLALKAVDVKEVLQRQ